MTDQAEKKLRAARSFVLQLQPFFGSLALKQTLVATDSIKETATDGDNLYYNPEYVNEADQDYLKFQVGAQAITAALGHSYRRNGRDEEIWNQASDFIVNPILKDAGFHLPPEASIRQDLIDTTVERAYGILWEERQKQNPNQPQPQGQSGGQGNDQGQGGGQDQNKGRGQGQNQQTPSYGGGGAVIDAPTQSAAEQRLKEQEWKIAMNQAANAQKIAGSVPGSVEALLESIRRPVMDWKQILWEMTNSIAQDDYSWSKVNRRFVADGLYLPSLHSETVGDILLVVDASGSMPNEALQQAASESLAIAQSLGSDLHVIVHDTKVRNPEPEVFEGDIQEIKLEIQARGGTMFAPVCKHINDELIPKNDYACVVWFTDLWTSDWADCEEPPIPTLFLDFLGKKADTATFGEVIKMEGWE